MLKSEYCTAMSLAPSTEANLISRLFKSKKRAADAEMRGATGIARKDIERIVLEAFFIIHQHRNQASATMKTLDQKTIAFATMKITGILKATGMGNGIDWDLAASLIDNAIWALMIMVSTRDPLRGFMTDEVAAYVMRALLFPLKRDTMGHDCESLLYKTVHYSDFKFGSAMFAAVVSRNDQLFRERELYDVGAIRLFEERYQRKVGNGFVATRS
jgi:hypothetical protein